MRCPELCTHRGGMLLLLWHSEDARRDALRPLLRPSVVGHFNAMVVRVRDGMAARCYRHCWTSTPLRCLRCSAPRHALQVCGVIARLLAAVRRNAMRSFRLVTVRLTPSVLGELLQVGR